MMEWSHTGEAIAQLAANIQAKPKEWLHEVVAEIRSCGSWEDPVFDEESYRAELQKLTEEPLDALADIVIRFAEELQTCTNGGGEAYCCPHHCSSHLVSFDPEREVEDHGPDVGGEG